MEQGEITQLLLKMRSGDLKAEETLAQSTYGELRRIAQHLMRAEREDHTLQPTAIIHEAYLTALRHGDFQNRAHFFAVAAKAMRRVLVDYARTRSAQKRGIPTRISFEDGLQADIFPERAVVELLDVDRILTKLEQVDPRQAQIVELRFFAGLTQEEIGKCLGVTTRTVERDWRMAKAWLASAFEGDDAPGRRVEREWPTAKALLESAFEGADAPKVGEVINNRYTLLRKLGSGGSSSVFEAEDAKLQKRVVVKFLDKDTGPLLANVRARQEVAAARQVSHSGINRVIEMDALPNGTPFVVMNYVPGESLRNAIDRRSITLEQALRILTGICGALQALHEADVLHLDLKPDNVILSNDAGGQEKVVLIDLGSAQVMNSGSPQLHAGTPRYIAPEQLYGRPSIRSDIFAVGMVSFELLTGHLPEREASEADIATTLESVVPTAVSKVIARALARDEKDRFHSISSFYSALIKAAKPSALDSLLQRVREFGPVRSNQKHYR